MTSEQDDSKEVNTSLSKSIANENLFDVLTTIGDARLSVIMESATTTEILASLSSIPVLGILAGMWKANSSIQNELYFRKVVRFLRGLNSTSAEDRAKFITKLGCENKIEKFGETILLLLERVDDINKPSIIGRIMAAHINGHLDYEKAMRLAAIVNRCYAQDLEYLRKFREGTQGNNYNIADALFSVGLLANKGIDGGTIRNPFSGGTIYSLNEYGEALQKYGWDLA